MQWKVKFFDYPLQFNAHEAEYIEIIRGVLSRGAFILGEDLSRFEENFAEFIGSNFAVGVSCCTDAMLLSLYAAGVGPGDEVISVSHTFVATIEVIKFLGAKTVFVDIADDHNMDVDLVESAITPKTKAIIPVHLNGRICSKMDKLVALAERYNLAVIEDAAQALGATYKGRGAGTFGLTGCFSFYPAKLLGTFGDAGAVVTDDEAFAGKIRMLRNHGRGKGTDINFWGLNCRMDNLHAAILDFKLPGLGDRIKRRRELAASYHEGLSGLKELRLPPPPVEDDEHYDVFQNYEIEAETRDELMSYLRENGVEVVVQWGGKAVHQFKALGLGNFSLPRTEEFFKKALLLPLYPELGDDQVLYVVQKIREFYG
ncbi:MAG: DegT/DnrJ/EryC1/StrS family aminotransferase [Nitrospirota bacterium]|nr:DegT/DnrJ/EryC1/StrS family aminotransferase [Nitrospirota bacterium]